jgi:Xaa-Pro aminopeptidase
MTEFFIPAGEIEKRCRRLQKKLQKNRLDGALIVQRVDLLYFSGTAQNGVLYMPVQGEPVLLVKKFFPRARRESPLKNVMPLPAMRNIPKIIIDRCGSLPNTLGFELDVMPVNDFSYYRSLFPSCSLEDASPLILAVRMIKSKWEIEQIEKTAEMSRKTFVFMKQILTPGMTEMEFAAQFEAYARQLGHGGQLRIRDYQTEGYAWHVLSGTSGGMTGLLDSPASGEGTSPAFPCGAGHKKIRAGEPVMVDFSSVLNGYHMDETRMFAVGSMPEEALKACDAAIQIHQDALSHIQPGITTTRDLYKRTIEIAVSLGYQENYLGIPGHKVSFVGHGIGLELVELPLIAKSRERVLEPGMTFALEPKLVFENRFIAGVESVILVTKTGARLISRVPPQVFIC